MYMFALVNLFKYCVCVQWHWWWWPELNQNAVVSARVRAHSVCSHILNNSFLNQNFNVRVCSAVVVVVAGACTRQRIMHPTYVLLWNPNGKGRGRDMQHRDLLETTRASAITNKTRIPIVCFSFPLFWVEKCVIYWWRKSRSSLNSNG